MAAASCSMRYRCGRCMYRHSIAPHGCCEQHPLRCCAVPSYSYSFGMVSACALRVCRAHPPFHIRLRYSMGACNPAENIFGTGCRSQPCVCYICVPARVAMVAVRDHYCTGYPCVFPRTLVYCRGVQGCPPGDTGIRAFPGRPLTDAAFQVQASYALLSAPV